MFLEAYRTGAPLDPHIGDMVVTLLAVAEGRSAFRVARVTQHLTTNLEVVRLFTGREYRVVEEDGGTGLVEIL
jgi:RNA 3'-terminal phosphate cyclase (ATP)